MVCDKCEKKLPKQIISDVWKDGARNKDYGLEYSRKSGGNMILMKKATTKKYFDPFGDRCSEANCKVKVEKNFKYCNKCSYKKGVCKMCGVKLMGTKFYKMSNV